MSLRSAGRQLIIHATTGLGLDVAHRLRERRAMRGEGRSFVRVLYLHGTPVAYADRLRRQLAWLRRRFELIDFDAFKARFDNPQPASSDRPAVLLTFDDGLASNYEVAAPLLEEAGTRGLFFVVPAFSLATGEHSRRLYAERIRGRADRYERGMSPAEIRDLADRGHAVGNHTFSHARLSHTPPGEYGRELLESAAAIESWTGRAVEAFAWPFVWDAITPAAHRIAAGRHRFCFSPCTGRVDPHTDAPALLWRTNAEVDRSLAEFRFQCSGLADHASLGRRRRLRRLLAARGADSQAA
jgi:peptidoglycan/xylan/chitin deacetylase (PgdA/CDA1 family)